MFTIPRHRRPTDQGMTLVEIMVAIFLLAVVGTVVAGVVITSMRLTTKTTSGIHSQSQLNDAIARITRDIAAADPILWTSTSHDADWPANTPAQDDIWVQSVQDGNCVRTRYWVADGDNPTDPKALKSAVQRFATDACPDPMKHIAAGDLVDDQPAPAPVISTLVRDLKTTADDGATELKVFTYYNKNNAEIPAPVTRANVPQIARVQIDLGSYVTARDKGVRLATSVAPRGMNSPLVTANGLPLPNCIDTGFRVVSTNDDPSAPRLDWNATPNGTHFTVNRLNPNPGIVPGANRTTVAPGNVIDEAMRGYHAQTITYSLTVEGPGGTVECGPLDLGVDAHAPLPIPTLTVGVEPNTSAAPATFAGPTISLDWTTVPLANVYELWRRPIDGNTAPYNATGTGSWTFVKSYDPATTSDTLNVGYNAAFEYKIVAKATQYKNAVGDPLLAESDYSDGSGKTLTHTDDINLSGTAVTYRHNRLTWTKATDPTVDGYAVFRRPTGSTNWTKVWDTNNVDTLTYNDTSVGLDTRYDYQVASFNIGPRGNKYGIRNYYGNPSNVVEVLQYPAVPVTTARGTEANNAYNPDGTNSVQWTPAPTATSYKVYTADTEADARRILTDTDAAKVGAVLSYTDAAQPRGSRNFYMAVACNPTGCSENEASPLPSARAFTENAGTPVTGFAAAYQRPTPVNPKERVYADSTTRPNLDSNVVGLTFTRTADAGETTDTFCSTNADLCTYKVDATGYAHPVSETLTGAPSGTGNTANYTYNANTADDDDNDLSSMWGRTGTWAIDACNPGGCANPTTTQALHYPGKFAVTAGRSRPNYAELDHYSWWEPNNSDDRRIGGTGRGQRGSLQWEWSNSAGVRSTDAYRVTIAAHAHDEIGRGNTVWHDKNTNIRDFTATPGAAYSINIRAVAPNGRVRDADERTAQMMPVFPGFMESDRFCRTGVTGYHIGYRFKRGGYTRNNGTYDAYMSTVEAQEYVGRVYNASNLKEWLRHMDRVYNRADKTVNGNGVWANSWTQANNTTDGGGFTEFWRKNTVTANGSMTITRSMVNGQLNAADDFLIPRQSDTGGSYLLKGIVNATGAHNTNFGAFESAQDGDTEFTPDGNLGAGCPGSWGAQTGFISRKAHPSSPGFGNPNSKDDWGVTG